MDAPGTLVRLTVLGTLAASFLVGVADPANAATFTVTKTADTNDGTCSVADCSLREAIGAANAAGGADTISVPAGTYQLSIANAGGLNEDNNASGDLDVKDALTIQGAGSGTTIIQAGTSTASGIDKVFALNPICSSGFDVTIDGVTVRFGRNTQVAGAPDFSFTGGGIDWCAAGAGGTFNLTNSVVSDNTNVYGYGGGLNIDTVSSPTTVNLTNDTFQNNTTLSPVNTANGGAVNIFGGSPTVNVTNDTFTGNTTTNATSGGGAIYFRPTTVGHLSVSGSSFSSNTAAGIGGAIATDAHGAGTTVSIQTSTFTGNTATNSFGGALDLDGTALTTTPFALSHLRLTGNGAGTSGGAVYVGNSNVTMSKSLIVGNSAPLGSGIHKSVDVATATVTGNWWGCSTGPSAAPCDTATTLGGTLTYAPWYRDRLTATTSPVAVNQSTSLTASFLTDSGINAVPLADVSEIIGRSVAWAATHGSLSSTQATVQAAGTATASFRATSAGTAVISAKVDNDNITPASSNILSLTVNKSDTTAAITNGTSLSTTGSATGQAVAVNFSVTGAFGNSPTAPTGTVTVSDGTDSCTSTVTAGTCSLTFTTAGVKSLTATYGGDGNFNTSSPSASVSHTVTTGAVDDTPPTASVRALPRYVLTGLVPVRWIATDTQSLIAGTDLRTRSASWNGSFFSGFASVLSGSAATSVSVATQPGRTQCFSARATDTAGNVSAWSPESCTATPADDRIAHKSSGWKRKSGTGYYGGSALLASHRGSKLTVKGVHARQISLVVSTGRRNGKIAVLWGGVRLGTWSLASSRTSNRRLIAIKSWAGVRTGTLVVKVVSAGKPVRIDGFALSQR
jgi:CSLREA domain-containing protein